MALDYPSTLPNPTASLQTPKPRAVTTDLPGADVYAVREYDYCGTIDVEFFFTSDQAAVFWAWWKNDLLLGGRWFNCNWPGIRPGPMVVLMLTQPRLAHVYNGSFRYTAQVEVRGASLGVNAANATAASIYNKIVGWWELDEATGSVVHDSHINELHGTLSGLTVAQPGLAASLGTSFANPGGTAYISIPHQSPLSITGSVSTMAWVKRSGVQDKYPKLLWKRVTDEVGGKSNYLLYQDNDTQGGRVGFRVSKSSVNYDVVSSTALADATVYQVIGTRNGTALKLYLNGVQNGSSSGGPTGALDTLATPILCGYSSAAIDSWVGGHDQFAVFNDELTAAEVAYLYAAGAGVAYETLRVQSGH